MIRIEVVLYIICRQTSKTINKMSRKKLILTFLLTLTLIPAFLLGSMTLAEEPTYKGAEFCGVCHPENYESWLETSHADAAGIHEQNASGIWYYVAADAHRIYTEEDFLASCRDCHVTGWDEEAQTWPEKDTDPGKFLGIQCEYCHGPYQSHGPGNEAMTLDYAAAVCDDCHNQPGDHALSGHSTSAENYLTSDHPSDSCIHCLTTQGFIGLDVTLETEGLVSISCAACHDSHSAENHYQLRNETPDDLCEQCHVGSHHPQSEFHPDGPHDRADSECVDCHGQGTRLWHGAVDEWFNHTFWIYNTYYPYNQTEPMVCSKCHDLEWSTEQLEVIETLTAAMIANATEVVEKAEAAIEAANATSGVSEIDITGAAGLAEEADSIISYVAADASGGLHNPEKTYTMLNYATHLASEAESSALSAKASALGREVSSLETSVSSLESDKSSLESQVATLESQVSSLEGEVEASEAQISSGRMTNIGIGAIVGVIIGAAAVFFLTKK